MVKKQKKVGGGEDAQTWGNAKKNYYQERDDEYSSVSEEEQQAEKIYYSHYELNNNQQYYHNQQHSQHQSSISSQQSDHQYVSHQYLNKQLKWVLKLSKNLPNTNQYTPLFKKVVNCYLLVCLSLKQFKLPYIGHHPIVGSMIQIKNQLLTIIPHLKTNTVANSYTVQEQPDEPIPQSQQQYHQQQQYSQQSQQQQANSHSSQYGDEQDVHHQQKLNNDKLDNGIKLYKQFINQRKDNKNKRKNNNNINNIKEKKIAFEEIKQHQGRLATQAILKNKGLVKKRKKIDGNSRVKLRVKYRKALSKQRALGHFIRDNPGRLYQGETNIKYGKIASVKLK